MVISVKVFYNANFYTSMLCSIIYTSMLCSIMHGAVDWSLPGPMHTGEEVLFGPGAWMPSPVSRPACQPTPDVELADQDPISHDPLPAAVLLEEITARVACLQIDEQRLYIAKIAALLSPSILGLAPPKGTIPPGPAQFKRKLFSSAKGKRQSARLRKLQSSFSTSRRSQAAICKQIGLIDKLDDFTDDTLLEYVELFKTRLLPGKLAGMAAIAGVSSASELRLPDVELQALLDELHVRSS
jgi:hypothetical protein